MLISDGYSGYQQLAPQLAGMQQCCQHVIRRCRAVTRLGPGSLQSWAGDIIAILRDAHQAVDEARARGAPTLDPELLEACANATTRPSAFGIMHNRLRDWDNGNHPGYALGCWLRDYKQQVFLFTRDFAVDWTNDLASHCTSWGRCAVSGLVWWSWCLGARIVACASDISWAAGGSVGVAAA